MISLTPTTSMNLTTRLLFVLFSASLCACGGLTMKVFSPRNPTTYVFNHPMTDVRLAIERAFRARSYRNLTLATKAEDISFADSVFAFPENQFDGFLFLTTRDLGVSDVYKFNGEPSVYYANFHLHVEAVDERSTVVDVRTIDPSVVVGKGWSIHGPASRFQRVKPTTIEEYEILRRIGEELGEVTMPPTRRPAR